MSPRWLESKEEWARAEGPLKILDSIIDNFAFESNLDVEKNIRDSISRGLSWNENNSRCLIQLYLNDPDKLTWNLWLCVSQDRDDGIWMFKQKNRYWKKGFLFEDQRISEFQDSLQDLLYEGQKLISDWAANPTELEFAVRIESQ